MKMVFILMTAAFLHASAGTEAQDISFSGKDITLEKIFDVVKKQTDFNVFYKASMLKGTRPVTVFAKNISLESFLREVLKDQPLDYTIKSRNIIISRKAVAQPVAIPPPPLFTVKDIPLISVSGLVRGSDDLPLAGVSVLEKGTSNGTSTNSEGRYTLNVPNVNGTLVFSFVGYVSREVAINGRSVIDLILVAEDKALDDIVVVAYGAQKKAHVTGSVATVKGEKIVDIPVANVSNTLVGRLPGLIAVNRSGRPGADEATISIRGFDNMLVIIDGIEQSMNKIDPNEIESISILKDASAAIYGARAGNGVVVITTKRGASGKPVFNFSSSYGVQTPTRLPKFVDAPTFAKVINDAEASLGRAPKFSEEEIEKYRNGTDPAYPNTDWVDELFVKWTPISQYNLNTSGGSDRVKYFFSLGYVDQHGMLRSGDAQYRRYNMRSNIDAKISDNFSVSLDLSGNIEQRDYPGATTEQIFENLFFAQPIYPARFPDETKLPFYGQSGSQAIGRANKAISGYSYDNRKNLIAQLNLKYAIPFVKGLTATAALNYSPGYNYLKDWRKQFSLYTYDRATDIYTVASVMERNTLNETMTRFDGMTNQVFLNYNKVWGAHSLNAMALGEFIQSKNNTISAYREGFITTAIDQLFAGQDLNKNNNGSANEDGRMGYAGRFNYSYAGKYFAEATFRYDASAKFIEDERWGFFPGILLGWRVSEENFMQNVAAISNLKLRFSHGLAGNDYVGRFNYLTGYRFGGNAVFGETPLISNGIVSRGLANPDLTWEKTATTNFGVDADFLNGRLGMELDVFYRKVTDVPGRRYLSLPTTFGATLPEENINSFDNRGFELLLRYRDKAGDFNYLIEGNVSWARAKWINYDEPVYPDDATRERLQLSGQWKNRWFGYEALGLFQSQDEIDKWPVIQDGNNNTTIKPGDIKYADYNGDGALDFRDNHVIGRGTTPEIIFGLNLSGNYKGFDLSMLWQGASNFNAYFTNGAQVTYFNGTVPYDYLADYWSEDNKNARFPRVLPGGATNNGYQSTFWLQNANYLRLKNFQIGYSFPGLAKSGVIQSLRLFISGYNLVTIDKVYPFDPETGTDRGWHYPQQKSVSAGINLTF
ncbi:TonB-dependent receptor [Agriterribacter sp.]|uniref:TonB-dependent receptor n=1 Tax=Agriterribacter sp. TaxID=2821509 RepID=UPI002BAA10D0|nr:TonB-dependent receptor [Agriterribacter sp.]HRO45715.1 TonB-dependent receptor [Agriterribacter sp.]HRQ15807.1 TonB-dependent receptor [Agriterribacter sp.]